MLTNSDILIVGPEYRNHRGGVGAVIAEHKRLFAKAAFYCSYKPMRPGASVLYGAFKLLIFPFFMLLHPRIRVVHIHGASRGSFHRKYLYFLISKLFGKKVVYHIHGAEFHLFISESSSRVKQRIERMMTQADEIVVLSDGWLEFFRKHYPKARLRRIYNPIREQRSKSFPAIGEKVRFLFLGYISDRKGCYDILEAAGVLRNSHPGFHVTIGGNGETQKIEATIAQMQLENHVAFKGWVSGSEKEQLLRDSDVYLLPSYNEGLPVSILEAMSFGMPVIATPVGGIPEMIEDRSSGLLIEPGDVASLVESMRFFLEKPETIKQMGLRAQELIREKFASHVIQAELRELYVKLLKAGRKHGN